MPLTALIFDVEGTLIDCVPHVLACWRAILASAGYTVSPRELQRYSGMDGSDMLKRLLPDVPNVEQEALLKLQGEVYRRDYLQLARPIVGVRGLFEEMKRGGVTIGIATTSSRDELRAYDEHMHVLDLADATACGDDAKKGKPHPDLYRVALDKLGLTNPQRAMAIGDTPYDAEAAAALGMPAAGVLTGGFTREELVQAGCSVVLGEVTELAHRLAIGFPAQARRSSPSTARSQPS